MPRRGREALLDKVEAFAVAPFTANPAARPLRGHSDVVRLRHGDWRAVCRLDRATDTVILERVAHRREIYR
jgi:mRNA interferase RelE/StbE